MIKFSRWRPSLLCLLSGVWLCQTSELTESALRPGPQCEAPMTGQQCTTTTNATSSKDAESSGYLGNRYYREGKLQEAEAAYLAAIRRDPENPRYRSNLAAVYVRRGDYEEALEAFAAAKDLDPTDGTLAKNLASAEMFWKFDQMAQALLNNTTKAYDLTGFLSGSNYSEKVEVAFKFALEQRRDLQDAGITLLRRAHAEKPGFAVVAHLLADALMEKHKVLHPNKIQRGAAAPLLDEARDTLERSLDLAKALRSSEPPPSSSLPVDAVLHVVCVASSWRPELDRLQVSVERVGLRLKVLGLGQPWRGLGSKITLLRDHIADLANEDLLLFVDAYDVLLLSNAKEMARTFVDNVEAQTPGTVLFGAELNAAPDAALRLVYPMTATPFRFLNSGTYLGRVRDVEAMLRAVQADLDAHHIAFGADPLRFDDQRWFNRFLLTHSSAALDSRSRFFLTLHDVDTEDLDVGSDAIIRSHITGTTPFLIHGNGNGIDAFHNLSADLATCCNWPLNDAYRATLRSI